MPTTPASPTPEGLTMRAHPDGPTNPIDPGNPDAPQPKP